jgi:uncharacterized protein (TIGR03083 family)
VTTAPEPLLAAETLAAEWGVLRAWVDAIPAGALDRASVLDGFTVRDLVAHVARGVTVPAHATVGDRGATPMTVASYVGQYAGNATAIATGTRTLSVQRADDLGVLLDESWALTRAWLDERAAETVGVSAARRRADGPGGGNRVVVAKRGPIRLEDLVRTRTLELVVHADDLARSVPEVAPPQHSRPALKDVVKLLLDVLVERAPGGSVEVRVPPFAAVQCIEGTSHTRGTPPNTVETDALTWIRLACGRITWDEATSGVAPGAEPAGVLHASGTRVTELAARLPLL